MATSVFIDGEAGTTGLQIRERLAGRADLQLETIDPDKRKDPSARAEILNDVDVAILCLPNAAAEESVGLINSNTTRVIDASTAHRVHPEWAYGFPEMSPAQRESIRASARVSNPGCYPQGLIATVRPLIDAGLLAPNFPVTYHAISGYTGGGKQMIADYENNAAAKPYFPYGLNFAHKHVPEMTEYSGLVAAPVFEPAVGNYAQGMLCSVPLHPAALGRAVTAAELYDLLAARYQDEPFIKIFSAEETAADDLSPERWNDSNMMALHVFANDSTGQAALIAVYDNLGKGASGAAVQNLNLMIGAAETEGL